MAKKPEAATPEETAKPAKKSAGSVTLGQMVHYNVGKDEVAAMVVTKLNDDGTFNGQVLRDGTDRDFVANAEIGDKPGQVTIP